MNPWGIPERFTPGPWRIIGLPVQARILGPRGEAVAACRAKYRALPDVLLRDSNARLIAASPDVLAALCALVVRCDGAEGVRADGSNIDTSAAHAAIDKALGVERERGL